MTEEMREANDLLQDVRRSVTDVVGQDFTDEVTQLLLAQVILELRAVQQQIRK